MSKSFIHYQVSMEEAFSHLFNITCHVNVRGHEKLVVSLPSWIPGSYLIRDFAKNIVQIKAFCGGKELQMQKLDKDSWSVQTSGKPITVYYQIYARDLSVRTAFLDQFRAFFNGTSLFIRIHGLESKEHVVSISKPEWLDENKNWKVATSMPQSHLDQFGFGDYTSASYDALIDHPFEISEFLQSSFRVQGVRHDVVVVGCPHANIRKICNDLKLIVKTQIKFWGELPVDRYTFLINAVSDGYGGLEHSHSTALICSKLDLPTGTDENIDDNYLRFLGLCSHEYFHLWNVKRLKPEKFSPYDLTKENYTELLWAFEGITSYYDDLMLCRAGLIDANRYLNLLAKTITSVKKTRGHSKQTLAESSYYAWTKFYKQDESAINTIVSYYTKGSLAALSLDLHLRKKTKGRTSLDTVMRALWKKYGRTGIGIPEDGIEAVAAEVSGLNLKIFFDQTIRSTQQLPLKKLLSHAGIELHFTAPQNALDSGGVITEPTNANVQKIKHDLGFTYTDTPSGLRVKQVFDNSAAQRSGLAPQDMIVAFNRTRPSKNNVQRIVDLEKKNTSIPIHIFRDDVLHKLQFKIEPAQRDTAYLHSYSSENSIFSAWLK
jgi:predicted metalloprotease with PDZ domain